MLVKSKSNHLYYVLILNLIQLALSIWKNFCHASKHMQSGRFNYQLCNELYANMNVSLEPIASQFCFIVLEGT